MNFISYASYIFLLVLGMLAGAWLDSQIQPVVSLPWVQQGLIDLASYLLVYVVGVWGFIFLSIIFKKRILEESEGGNRENKADTGFLTSLMPIAVLVGIPLTLILWVTVGSMLF